MVAVSPMRPPEPTRMETILFDLLAYRNAMARIVASAELQLIADGPRSADARRLRRVERLLADLGAVIVVGGHDDA
jgi:hypothetical protein